MRPLHVLGLALAAAVLTAAAFVALGSRSVRPVGAPAAAAPGAEERGRIAALEVRLRELEQRLDGLRMELRQRSAAVERAPVLDIEGELERWWREREPAAQAGDGVERLEQADAGALLAELLDPTLAAGELGERLQELRRSGDLDALIEELQGHLLQDPTDASSQLLLAQACIERIQAGDLGAEAGELAALADKAFDAALQVDPHNGHARFAKAEALSYWPPASGKQAEAITQIELLLEQHGASAPMGAQPHVLLGKLYLDAGKPQLALATWNNGLALLPGNELLQHQIAAYLGQ